MSRWLDELCEMDNLRAAWSLVRRKKRSAGVDGQSITAFERHADDHLRRLRDDLRRGVYEPLPLRGFWLPKSREGGWRRVGSPCVRDRVAQRACLNLIGPRFDVKFRNCSHAYRPGRSIHGALATVGRWRDEGMEALLDADIENCFDNIHHDLLFERLKRFCPEPALADLIEQWLGSDVRDSGWPAEASRVSGVPRAGCGLPQGDLLSPLLCNLFLHELDDTLTRRRLKMVRYADDFLIAAPCRERAAAAGEIAGDVLHSLGLRLNTIKTQVVTFDGGFEYLGTLFVGSLALPRVRREHQTGQGKTRVSYHSGYDTVAHIPPRRETRAAPQRVPQLKPSKKSARRAAVSCYLA